MRIIFAGTPEFAATALNALLQTNHTVVAVYTQPDRKSGRGQKLTPSAVKQVAINHNIPVFQPLNFRSSTEEGIQAQKQLEFLNADIMIVAAYGIILPQAILDMPKYGCLNIHASLLPRWRGAAPIQRAIAAQDKETGITIMQMAAGLDTGDMLLKKSCSIESNDSTSTLHDKLSLLGAEAIVETLSSVTHLNELLAQRQIQKDDEVTYASKLTKQEAQIDWNIEATQIVCNINAFNPWPVAFIQLSAENIRVWKGKVSHPKNSNELDNLQVGTILDIDHSGVSILCGKNTVITLTNLQWPGGKPLNSEQILQTQKLAVGQVLI